MVDIEPTIRDVWESNLEKEMGNIRDLIEKYPFVAMDTEFPGVVSKFNPSEYRTQAEYAYKAVSANVNSLKLIQLGISLFDAKGNIPPTICSWQFNFKFALESELYAQDSIDLLTRSGIQFARHKAEGIDVNHFAELLISSGLVMNEDITWITFHSSYDFAYLLRVLTAAFLPDNDTQFFELIKIYFPVVYDVKYLMRSCKSLKGGLQDVADDLRVARIGPQHQAGSDSLLTGHAFFRMREVFFDGIIDPERFNGVVFGLGTMF